MCWKVRLALRAVLIWVVESVLSWWVPCLLLVLLVGVGCDPGPKSAAASSGWEHGSTGFLLAVAGCPVSVR